jgi:predicted alpha/beta-hydrolase family hydrolase
LNTATASQYDQIETNDDNKQHHYANLDDVADYVADHYQTIDVDDEEHDAKPSKLIPQYSTAL